MSGFLNSAPGDVLMCGTVDDRGEEDEAGTRIPACDAAAQPDRRLIRIDCTVDDDDRWLDEVSKLLASAPGVIAVYSITGRNAAIVEAFRQSKRKYRVFIGYNLDSENRALLIGRQVTVILLHDIGFDLLRACRVILKSSARQRGNVEAEISNGDHALQLALAGLTKARKDRREDRSMAPDVSILRRSGAIADLSKASVDL